MLIGILGWLRLQSNMVKTMGIVCHPGTISGQQYVADYGGHMTSKGGNHHVRRCQRVVCVCSVVQSWQRHKWPHTSRHSTAGQAGPFPHHCHFLSMHQHNTGWNSWALPCLLTVRLSGALGGLPVEPTYGCVLCTNTWRIQSLSWTKSRFPTPVQAVWYFCTPGGTNSRTT